MIEGKRIIVVEDEIIISQDIQAILRKHGATIVGSYYRADKAINGLKSVEADIALLDINLGGATTGIDIAAILRRDKIMPYIFLTSYSDPATLTQAQEQSPYGYLVKPFQEATLITTLSIALSNFAKQQDTLRLDRFDHITAQEKQLCTLLYQGKSYQDIADQLTVSINTVRYHVKNIYGKCHVSSRAELISYLLK